MASNNQITNPYTGVPARNTYSVRLPYLYQAKHHSDEFKNLGYNYTGKILKKTTSPELWGNPLNTAMFGQIESLITHVLETAKMVKKWFSISHEKETTKIL